MQWPTDEVPSLLWAPLFPLPNVVLFPGAILPLHIFEPRYRRMTGETIDGDGLVAMALLRPGWEKSYYGRAVIEPAVCVGKIVAHERMADGKYNLLLQGQWRATVLEERSSGGETPYRVGYAEPIAGPAAMEIDMVGHRQRLVHLFTDGRFGCDGLGEQFARLLGTPMSTEQIADLIAFNYLHDVPLKQALLAEANACERVERLVAALDETPSPPLICDSGDATLN